MKLVLKRCVTISSLSKRFNPHEGLWAESRMNTQFRLNTTKWRFPVGVGVISLAIKHVWDLFQV